MFIRGNQRQHDLSWSGCAAPWRGQSSKVNISGNQSQSEPISETMRGHQRQSVSIGCNQRQSVVKQRLGGVNHRRHLSGCTLSRVTVGVDAVSQSYISRRPGGRVGEGKGDKGKVKRERGGKGKEGGKGMKGRGKGRKKGGKEGGRGGKGKRRGKEKEEKGGERREREKNASLPGIEPGSPRFCGSESSLTAWDTSHYTKENVVACLQW